MYMYYTSMWYIYIYTYIHTPLFAWTFHVSGPPRLVYGAPACMPPPPPPTHARLVLALVDQLVRAVLLTCTGSTTTSRGCIVWYILANVCMQALTTSMVHGIFIYIILYHTSKHTSKATPHFDTQTPKYVLSSWLMMNQIKTGFL